MSYYTLQLFVRGLVLTLVLLALPASRAQDAESPGPIEESLAEAPADREDAGPATHEVNQPTVVTNEVAPAEIPAIRVESPPPQIIQVQMPTMPVMAREDIELLVNRLTAIEQRMVGQQENAMSMVIRSNQSILAVAAILGGLSLVGIVGAAIILMRAFNRFSDVMLTLPMGQQLGRGMSLPSLAMDDLHPVSPNALEQVSARFLGALEQLEKRIRELETEPALANPVARAQGNGNTRTKISHAVSEGTSTSPANDGPSPVTVAASPAKSERELAIDSRPQVHRLLEQGESLLQNEKFDDALTRFDEALAIEPRNSDALIKRGMALERLQRMDAALESYDRAIATNGSLTLAYLHKGAICNRLQRYREALECYERALQAEQKS
jgi:TolA-binding protein